MLTCRNRMQRDGQQDMVKDIKKKALPTPSEGRGVQINRRMKIGRESINNWFIDYNSIKNKL